MRPHSLASVIDQRTVTLTLVKEVSLRTPRFSARPGLRAVITARKGEQRTACGLHYTRNDAQGTGSALRKVLSHGLGKY